MNGLRERKNSENCNDKEPPFTGPLVGGGIAARRVEQVRWSWERERAVVNGGGESLFERIGSLERCSSGAVVSLEGH